MLYTGFTNTLAKRVYEHREGLCGGFTRRYGLKQLAWFELHESIRQAREREARIKRWRRAWKIELIESLNPGWKDLWFELGPD